MALRLWSEPDFETASYSGRARFSTVVRKSSLPRDDVRYRDPALSKIQILAGHAKHGSFVSLQLLGRMVPRATVYSPSARSRRVLSGLGVCRLCLMRCAATLSPRHVQDAYTDADADPTTTEGTP